MFCAPQHRLKWEWYLCFCRCIWPQRKLKEDDPPFDPERPERLYSGYSWKDFLGDDGSYVGFFQRPVRVGASILIYGRREGRWPWHCMAGPDWPGTILVLFLIIGVHTVVLGTCSTCLGWVVQFIGWTGCFLLVLVYTSVSCSNPGLILKSPPSELEAGTNENALEEGHVNIERGLDDSGSEEGKNKCVGPVEAAGDESASEDSQTQSSRHLLIPENGATSPKVTSDNNGNGKVPRINPITPSTVVPQEPQAPPKPRTVACGQCEIQRPMVARHCQHCGQCIINIDHHCPWSGKCIAQNNLNEFNIFLCLLCFEVYFMLGLFVYYWVACWSPLNLPTGDKSP